MTRQSLGPQTWRCRGGMGEDVWWNFLRTAEHRKWKDLRVDHKVQRTEGGCRLLGLSNRDSEFGIRWKLGIPRGRKFFDWKKRIGHCGKSCEICGKTPLFFSISFNNSRFILIQSKIIIRSSVLHSQLIKNEYWICQFKCIYFHKKKKKRFY